ncbi:MAG: DUF924 family protein [Microcoleaceae cyanobacterium]
MASFAEILTFWFGHPESEEFGKIRKVWFTKSFEFDREIRDRFLADYELAAQGQWYGWQHQPQSCLALVLLLDQFPRNLFRGQPQAFATDYKALTTAKFAIEQGFDQHFPPTQRAFFYLPLEHSETLADQRQSAALFRQLGEYPDLESYIDYAVRHLEVIQRFGRFPHRNQILGRVSTPEELDFLQQPGSAF